MKKKYHILIFLVLTYSLQYSYHSFAQQKYSTNQSLLKTTTSNKWVTAYYPLWAIYNYTPQKVDYTAMTHIIVFSYNPSYTYPYFSGTVPGHRDSVDWHQYGSEDTLIKRAHAAGVNVLMCLGGIWGTGAATMAWIAADSIRTQVFTNAALAYARRHGYDGVDLDWEQYIVKDDYSRFLRIFRRGLNTWSPRGLFSTATGYTPSSNYDITQFAANLDQVNIMTYDYNLGNRTWFNSPLRLNPTWTNFTIANGWSIADHGPQQWIDAGFPKEKLAIALPFYTSLNIGNDRPNQPTVSSRLFRNYQQAVEARAAYRNDVSYAEGWDEYAKCSWFGYTAGGIKYYWSYDDSAAFYWKIKLANSLELGGIMLYDLVSGWITSSQTNPLLRAVKYLVNLTPTIPATTPRIRGEIFFDYNQNRIKDTGEPSMAGWKILLGGTQPLSTITDSLGQFKFEHLPTGTYIVSVEIKSLWQCTQPSIQPYSVLINTDTADVVCNFGAYTSNALGINLTKGWNIISLPLKVPDPRSSVLFPTATSGAYIFNDANILVDSLKNGLGFFMKFSANHTIWLAGTPILNDTIEVKKGWNLFGSISNPVPVNIISSNPPGIISSLFWAYKNAYYYADTIKPGLGYWVKINESGKLILQNPYLSRTEVKDNIHFIPDSVNFLKFKTPDGYIQELFFTSKTLFRGEQDISKYEIPPFLSAFVNFDVRFIPENNGNPTIASVINNDTGESDISIQIHSINYPIKLEWEICSNDPQIYEFISPDNSVITITGKGSFLIPHHAEITSNDYSKIYRLAVSSQFLPSEPSSFNLIQNYPNPFNGNTQISFFLPSDGYVRLEVYDVIGRIITTLVDSPKKKGSHIISFHPSENLSSGIYFSRLYYMAQENVAVKTNRMLYIR